MNRSERRKLKRKFPTTKSLIQEMNRLKNDEKRKAKETIDHLKEKKYFFKGRIFAACILAFFALLLIL